VVDSLKTNLLGLPAINDLELAVRVDSVNNISTADVKEQFPSVFSGLGNLGEE